ncbi:LA_3334 family protein [Leptospira ainazelensis]|uniref:LA_3334 family protein n=1 Tax=Leptospira ainazelensis TaxID=2810034 RepID=UPI002FC71557
MNKLYISVIVSLIVLATPLLSSELLLKSGDAFLIEEINESADTVSLRWKGRLYRIPKSEIQRIDYARKGPESSYQYSEFQLTDGSSVRGIIVERKKDKITFKTELGFVEIEKAKIQNSNSKSLESDNESPDLPDKYLSGRSGENQLYVGGSFFAQANHGAWFQSNPATAGAGLFLEKGFLNRPLWFFGFLSEYAVAPSTTQGSISLWNQSFYLGKQFGSSAPYFLFGGGVTAIQWKSDSRSVNGTDPELLGEVGWAWDLNNGSRLRLGVRSQCTIESGDSLCRTGLRISWGFLL